MAESGLKVGSAQRTLFGLEIFNYLVLGLSCRTPKRAVRRIGFADSLLIDYKVYHVFTFAASFITGRKVVACLCFVINLQARRFVIME